MATVNMRPDESPESLLRRFQKKVAKSGILNAVRRKRWYVSKSELRRIQKKKALRRIRPGIDGLVLQAGGRGATFIPAMWEQLPAPEEFLRAPRPEGPCCLVLDVNLKGVFNCCKAAIRPMMKQRYGRIVNISSVVGLMGNAGQVNYAAAKAGVVGLTKTLCKEWGRYKVNVNCVAFGLIQTRLTQPLSAGEARINVEGKEINVGIQPNFITMMEKQMIPLGRAGTPEEAADAVFLFCSPEANYISGQTIVCGGGLTW